jgi:hypothetical protein
MLVPDYLAIGTLVILILGAVVQVYSEKRGVSLTGQALALFRSCSVVRRYRCNPRPKECVGTAYVLLSRAPRASRSRSVDN